VSPTVSVCVPTYNGKPYLQECLDSILAQSFEHFELIAVDDGSSDETHDVLLDYAKRDERIKVWQNSINLGLVGNWKRCIELASGDWLKFVFQDDFIHPRCLEELLKVATRDVPIVVCRRNIQFDDVSAETITGYQGSLARSESVLFSDGDYCPAEKFREATIQYLGLNFVGEPTTVLLHRDVFNKFGEFNSGLIQLCDFEYWVRVAMNTGLRVVREPLATFRVHDRSVSATNEKLRNFRSEVLDSLILLYEFAYNPEFAPLRRTARRLGVNLKRTLARKAYWAQGFARRAATDPVDVNGSLLEQWRTVVSAYPKLGDSMHLSIEKVRHELDRRFFWRLNAKAAERGVNYRREVRQEKHK